MGNVAQPAAMQQGIAMRGVLRNEQPAGDEMAGVNFFQGRADTAPSCDCRRDRPGPDLKRNPMRKTLLASTCLATLLSTAAHAETTIATARSEAHTSELQSLMRISYADSCLTK